MRREVSRIDAASSSSLQFGGMVKFHRLKNGQVGVGKARGEMVTRSCDEIPAPVFTKSTELFHNLHTYGVGQRGVRGRDMARFGG